MLKAIGDKYSDKAVKVDLTVHNPARISKLYGTFACKGDNTRSVRIEWPDPIETPDAVEVVARELLEAVASMSQTTVPPRKPDPSADAAAATNKKQDFDVPAYLLSHGVEISKHKAFGRRRDAGGN